MHLDPKDPSSLGNIPELLEGTIQETLQPGLFLLTSGPLPPNPAELVSSEKMEKLLTVLESYFDMIILDSPPALVVTDAVVLATRTDGLALVVKAGKTRRNELEQVVARIKEVDANILGVILNQLTSQTGGQYYTYYSRAYYDEGKSANGDTDSGAAIGSKAQPGLPVEPSKPPEQKSPLRPFARSGN